MAENPIGYFPDLPINWRVTPAQGTQHSTEVQTTVAGAESRRSLFTVGGYRLFQSSSLLLDPRARRIVDDWMNARRGMAQSAYFFENKPRQRPHFPSGSITSQ